MPGHWAVDETQIPLPCSLPDACLGKIEAAARNQTTMCAEGYKGDYCNSCDENYFKSKGACMKCGAAGSENAKFAAFLTGIIFFLLTMAVSVAFLPVATLNKVLGIVLTLQQMGTLGQKNECSVSPTRFV